MIHVGVSGASGRMGRAILESTENFKNEIDVSAVLEHVGSSYVGNIASVPGIPEGLKVSSDVAAVVSASDVLIEFTSPQATLANLAVVRKQKKAMVIGTTGLNDDELSALEDAAKDIPIVFAPNMSTGVNILFKVVEEVTKAVGEYFDIEIIEAHHHHKKDAPSGTAKKMAEIISETLGRELDKVAVYGRKGIIGARKSEEIGIHVVRAGDIVGDHTAIFAGPGERIELTHRAHSRTTFAVGALRAAIFIVGKKPGMYTMNDVLGL